MRKVVVRREVISGPGDFARQLLHGKVTFGESTSCGWHANFLLSKRID